MYICPFLYKQEHKSGYKALSNTLLYYNKILQFNKVNKSVTVIADRTEVSVIWRDKRQITKLNRNWFKFRYLFKAVIKLI